MDLRALVSKGKLGGGCHILKEHEYISTDTSAHSYRQLFNIQPPSGQTAEKVESVKAGVDPWSPASQRVESDSVKAMCLQAAVTVAGRSSVLLLLSWRE